MQQAFLLPSGNYTGKENSRALYKLSSEEGVHKTTKSKPQNKSIRPKKHTSCLEYPSSSTLSYHYTMDIHTHPQLFIHSNAYSHSMGSNVKKDKVIRECV